MQDTSLEALAAAAGDLLISLSHEGARRVSGLEHDSRRVSAGDLFVCIPGAHTDGHELAAAAVSSGAVALCLERPLSLGVPEIRVADTRRAMARMAAELFGRPADDLTLLGVTGTNGKTTTAFLLASILEAAGATTGLIGTIQTRIAGETRAGARTTPESLDLHRLFAEMRDRGVDSVAMEVTSHGLVLHRVEGLRFAAAAFTNLSQDHLDFHRDMQEYFEAKRSLFVPERSERGAANVDDPYGRKLKENARIPCIGFGTSDDADVRAVHVDLGHHRTKLGIVSPEGRISVQTSLVGAFNVSNCLAACATALQAGIDLAAIEEGLGRLRSVPGRFEAVDGGQPFTVVIDYAHTPDSLDNVLREARRLAASSGGRVICAFGCGGDRDRGKRPLMGATVARGADVMIITSDNPRSEEPRAIIDEIVEGVVAQGRTPDHVLVDRKEAISTAIAEASPGDVVVIAGKGHETGQELGDRTVPFDDRNEARAALRASGWGDDE